MRLQHLIHILLFTAVCIATLAPAGSAFAAGNFVVPQPCVTSPCYSGDGIEEGINQAETISGITAKDPRAAIIAILKKVVSYMALVAVVVIVIAGIWLVVSGGEEETKNKVRRMIFYTVIGLLIILFATVIVTFLTDVVANEVI